MRLVLVSSFLWLDLEVFIWVVLRSRNNDVFSQFSDFMKRDSTWDLSENAGLWLILIILDCCNQITHRDHPSNWNISSKFHNFVSLFHHPHFSMCQISRLLEIRPNLPTTSTPIYLIHIFPLKINCTVSHVYCLYHASNIISSLTNPLYRQEKYRSPSWRNAAEPELTNVLRS